MNVLDNLPNKLEKHFVSYSRIIIYPQLYNQNHVIERFEDISAEPLTKGIENNSKNWKKELAECLNLMTNYIKHKSIVLVIKLLKKLKLLLF